MSLRNYGISKTWLKNSLDSTVSEPPSTANMLMGAKHLWNPHDSNFIIFFHHSEVKWFAKYLPYWNLKSYGCLLTHWMLMTRIMFKIVRICSSLFKCNYLKNKKLFVNFLSDFWNHHQILDIFEKKMIVIANVFAKLQNVKDLVENLSWKRCFKTSFGSEHDKRSQTLARFWWEIFYHIFLITLRRNYLENVSLIEVLNLGGVC